MAIANMPDADEDGGALTVPSLKILVPQHVSATPATDNSTLFLRVYQSHGVAWRGLYPLLIEAPSRTCRKILRIMFRHSKNSIRLHMANKPSGQSQNLTQNNGDNDKNEDVLHGFHHRTIRLRRAPSTGSVTLLLVPPTISHVDTTFASVVIHTERLLLRLQTLTAWWSTLGGGYFFCRRLAVSLRLARQQRALALQIGNISMARQCSVNEAYNLIYAGKFGAANRVLTELEQSILQGANPEEGSVTLRQCQAARLLAKRLKKVHKRGLRGYHTFERGEKHAIDDYQRIRIVED